MYNLNQGKLNGKIVEKGMTKEGVAAELGISRATFYRRTRKNGLLLRDVHKICDVLGLTPEEAVSIFLSK